MFCKLKQPAGPIRRFHERFFDVEVTASFECLQGYRFVSVRRSNDMHDVNAVVFQCRVQVRVADSLGSQHLEGLERSCRWVTNGRYLRQLTEPPDAPGMVLGHLAGANDGYAKSI